MSQVKGKVTFLPASSSNHLWHWPLDELCPERWVQSNKASAEEQKAQMPKCAVDQAFHVPRSVVGSILCGMEGAGANSQGLYPEPSPSVTLTSNLLLH